MLLLLLMEVSIPGSAGSISAYSYIWLLIIDAELIENSNLCA